MVFGKLFRKAPEEPDPEELLRVDLHNKLGNNPVFQIQSADGLNWIEPYGGTLIPAPFDWQDVAFTWLLDKRPWEQGATTRSPAQMAVIRWFHHLTAQLRTDRRFRHLRMDGSWLNPYNGQWISAVAAKGKIDAAAIKRMAAALAENGPVESASLQSVEQLERHLRQSDNQGEVTIRDNDRAPPPTPAARPRATSGAIKRAQVTAKRPLSDSAISTPKISDLNVPGYHIHELLGTGGMSRVYRATQDSLQREIAFKVMGHSPGTDMDVLAERFLREARAAAAINHANVVTVYDCGRHEDLLYMSMELVTGGDTKHLAKSRGGTLDERRALEIIADAATGLAAIHEHGVIHRDIKPSNLFLTTEGRAKVADLGLAKVHDDGNNLTMTGAAIGTPSYMAPEQAQGDDDLDVTCDIYALGATLYALLSGQPPFSASNPLATLRAIINDEPPAIGGLRPDLSPATLALIARCMAKDRRKRYRDAATLARVTRLALADLPASASKTFRGDIAAAGHDTRTIHHAVNDPDRTVDTDLNSL
ncbi:MAG: serine/threonine-protein kinase [Planctomycetota bacterium]|jgi:serine/threonine protein kinase